MHYIKCLEDNTRYLYSSALTPYEALTKLLYTLNIRQEDKNAVIKKTNLGRYLWFEHSGKTYCIRNGI